MRAQLDRLHLQMQLVAEKSGDNYIANTTLQYTAAQLEHVLQGLTARVDGITNAGVVAGHAAAPLHGGLLTVMKLKMPKLYSGQMEDPAALGAFTYVRKLYFQLTHITLNT